MPKRILYRKRWFLMKNEKCDNQCNREQASASTQLSPTLCDPMNCSPPGSSAHGIFQARILEWVAISYSRGFSSPRDHTRISCISCVSCIGRQILYPCATWKARHATRKWNVNAFVGLMTTFCLLWNDRELSFVSPAWFTSDFASIGFISCDCNKIIINDISTPLSLQEAPVVLTASRTVNPTTIFCRIPRQVVKIPTKAVTD